MNNNPLQVFCGMKQIATWIVYLCNQLSIPIKDKRDNLPVYERNILKQGLFLDYADGLPCAFESPWGFWRFLELDRGARTLPIKIVREIVTIELLIPKPENNPEQGSIHIVNSIPKSYWKFPYPLAFEEKNTIDFDAVASEWELNDLFYLNQFIQSKSFTKIPRFNPQEA